MDPAMDFGGYVEPPSHLSETGKKVAPEARLAELRTVPDYDYSLFRYSRVALPWLFLILVSAAILIGLSFWQGPYGFIRGQNGFRDGTPREYELDDHSYMEAGIRDQLKGLRCANFVAGICPILIAIFAIRAQPTPGVLRIVLFFCAFILFALGVMSSVSFALGIDEVHWLKDCPDVTFPQTNFGPVTAANLQQVLSLRSVYGLCRRREQISSAGIVADMAQALSAFILSILLVYTSLQSNWAWGPGRVPVEKSANQPRITFPPPSPFTHIASTRRVYVWIWIFLTLAFVLIAFILTIKMHELRVKPRWVNARNERIFTTGWPQRNNRFRVSLSAFCIAACAYSLLDMYAWKRRVISYTLAIVLFWMFVGFLILFALDIKQLNNASNAPCQPPGGTTIPVKCVNWAFMGTCFVDFWTAFIIMLYLIYEFLYRVFATWETYYFYADSEWLRNHSLFVEQTDREAFDWKKFQMDTGKEYYYSPSLGISTRVRPRNYVEPEGGVPVAPLAPSVSPVFPAYGSPPPVFA